MARQVGHATERVLIKDIGWARRGIDMPPPGAVRGTALRLSGCA
jgi:hypothetical protein